MHKDTAVEPQARPSVGHWVPRYNNNALPHIATQPPMPPFSPGSIRCMQHYALRPPAHRLKSILYASRINFLTLRLAEIDRRCDSLRDQHRTPRTHAKSNAGPRQVPVIAVDQGCCVKPKRPHSKHRTFGNHRICAATRQFCKRQLGNNTVAMNVIQCWMMLQCCTGDNNGYVSLWPRQSTPAIEVVQAVAENQADCKVLHAASKLLTKGRRKLQVLDATQCTTCRSNAACDARHASKKQIQGPSPYNAGDAT